MFEMSSAGSEIIKGNLRLVETEKFADSSKMPWKSTTSLNYISFIVSDISIPFFETPPNAVAKLKYFIQVYVYLPAFRRLLYPLPSIYLSQYFSIKSMYIPNTM